MKTLTTLGLIISAVLVLAGNALAAPAYDSTVTQRVDNTSTVAPAGSTDTATVHGVSGVTPTGSVTYNFFADGTCSGSTYYSHAQTLNSDGSVPSSDQVAPLSAGNYSWSVTYDGDSNYGASSSSCDSFTLSHRHVTLAITVPNNNGLPGERASAQAYLSPLSAAADPDGIFTFKFFTNGRCSGSPQSVSSTGNFRNSVSATTGPLKAGSYSYKATYSNDSNYSNATSRCARFTVRAPSNRFKLFDAHVLNNGAVSFRVKVPGPGTLAVKGKHYRSLRRTLSRAGKFAVLVEPVTPGQAVKTTLTITYRPRGGSTATWKLHLT